MCRYCGLFDQSIAAHHEARRLDPNVPTSLEQTLLLTCDLERLLAVQRKPLGIEADEDIRAIGLGLAGRRDEARRILLEVLSASGPPLFRAWATYLLAWVERRTADAPFGLPEFRDLTIWGDPEAMFQEGWMLCDLGEYDRGIEWLARAVDKGYFVAPTLSIAPAFDAVRSDSRFSAIVSKAEAGRQDALSAFRSHGGERLLGR